MSDLSCQTALRDVVLDLNLTPKTTLTQIANVGDQVLHVADASKFLPLGLLSWDDTAGDETLAIKSVDPAAKTITLDFTGLGYTGLKFAHTNGAQVYTNLCTEAPISISPMLQLGDPVIFILMLDERIKRQGNHTAASYFTGHIEYRRLLLRPPNQQMNTNVWALRQQDKARADLNIMSTAILKNRMLQRVGGGTQMILTIGELHNPTKQDISKGWRFLTADQGDQVFATAMDIAITDRMTTF